MMEERKVPALRFQGFTDEWEAQLFGSFVARESKAQISSKAYPCVEYEDIIAGEGVLNKDVRSKGISKKGIKFDNTMVLYGKLRPYLHNMLVPEFSGVAVGDWWVLKPVNVNRRFLYILLQTKEFDDKANQSSGSKMPRADWNLISRSAFYIPNFSEEQSKIGAAFANLDWLIFSCKEQLAKLQAFKKSMLEKMFPRPGEKVPEVRFRGFMGDWEKRRFGELVDIERGGSPRPIDEYITDDYDGLNWVKIGDAPAQGRYIMHTEEKIKASGLSKTRQVFPGDLILSNSMSFGKPYIMGISGCIHDGWLLIRNSRNLFNLKFLCQMLGTEHMLSQYKSLAAGSTVNNLNKELVSNVIVNVPPLEEQVRIGAFLENIDDIISCCQRKLEKLQSMKQAMLSEMFI